MAAPNGSTTITVRDTPAQDLSQLNQDLAKAQELTKDTKSSVRVYVDRQAIEEIANGLPTIGAGLEELSDGLQQIVRDIRAATYALPEDLKHIGQSGEKAVETMLRAGVDQQTAEALMRNSDFSSSYTGLIDSIDQMLAGGFDSRSGSYGGIAGTGSSEDSNGQIVIDIGAGKSTPAGEMILNRLNELQKAIAELPLAEAQAAVLTLQVAMGGPAKTAISAAASIAFNTLFGDAVDQLKQEFAEKIVASTTDLAADRDIAPTLYDQALNGARFVVDLLSGIGAAVIVSGIKSKIPEGSLPWTSWGSYEKVTIDGKAYAKIGDRLYTEHAVNRMQPSGLGAPAGEVTAGRNIPPNIVEEVIRSGSTTQTVVNGVMRTLHKSGNVAVVTEGDGQIVVTILRYGSQ